MGIFALSFEPVGESYGSEDFYNVLGFRRTERQANITDVSSSLMNKIGGPKNILRELIEAIS